MLLIGLVLLATPAALAETVLPVGPARLGVVLLHGKPGAPDRLITNLAAALRRAG